MHGWDNLDKCLNIYISLCYRKHFDDYALTADKYQAMNNLVRVFRSICQFRLRNIEQNRDISPLTVFREIMDT